MSLTPIQYKDCGLGNAQSKVGDALLDEMTRRNSMVFGSVIKDLYFCECYCMATCDWIDTHIPPYPPIINLFFLCFEDRYGVVDPGRDYGRYGWNYKAFERFNEWVEENNICTDGTFYKTVKEFYNKYTFGSMIGDNQKHLLFSVPMIGTNTVYRKKGGNALVLTRGEDGVPTAGRLVTRCFVEQTRAYHDPSIQVTVCYEVFNLEGVSLLNVYVCRPSLLGMQFDEFSSYVAPSASGVDSPTYSCWCGYFNFSNPWIVDSSPSMGQWQSSPLVTGTDFYKKVGVDIFCNAVEELIHPHPYIPKGNLIPNDDAATAKLGSRLMPHIGSTDDYLKCVRNDLGEDFYYFCWVLNAIAPEDANEAIRAWTNCRTLADALAGTPESIGKALRVGVYRDKNGKPALFSGSIYSTTCDFYGYREYYSRAEIGCAPDYHEIIGCNIVDTTEEGTPLWERYGGCVIPSLCTQDWHDATPVTFEYNELITHANVKVTIGVKITGDKCMLVNTGQYTAHLKHRIQGLGNYDIGLYCDDGEFVQFINRVGGDYDITDLVDKGGGSVSFYIGVCCPTEKLDDPLNVAQSVMHFNELEIMLNNWDSRMTMLDSIVMPDGKFPNDF